MCASSTAILADTESRIARLRSLGDEYPFESHFLEVDGGRMHYVDEGTGPPILLLHGNPTWSFYYRNLIKGLRDRYRVIAPDHMGCGMSDKPRQYPYTLATHIENLTRLIEHLDLQKVMLGVHDWGGPIGFGWAMKHPKRVRGFALFNTAAFLGGRVPFRIRICGWPLLGSFLVLRLNAFAGAAIHMACCLRERMTAQVKRGYLLPYDSPENRIATYCFVRDIPTNARVPSYPIMRNIEDSLKEFQDHPMQIFWGMKDFCFTPTYLEQWRRRFPNAVIHPFEDAGHYVLEDAHERILPLFREFADSLVRS